LMGKNVLTAAKARYTQIPTTIHPSSQDEYVTTLETLLNGAPTPVKTEFIQNARRFLYKQLFMSSLPFDQFLEPDKYWKGYVTLNNISPESLSVGNSETMQVLNDAVLQHKPFELKP